MKLRPYFTPLLILLSCVSVLPSFANDNKQEMENIAQHYVRLVLALGQHDPVYVDAYYGPERLKQGIDTDSWPLVKIAVEGKSLQRTVKALPTTSDKEQRLRRHYLVKQLTALVFHAQQLQRLKQNPDAARDFNQEAVALYDTLPPTYDYSYFDQLLQELDASLPGQGELPERIAALQKQVQIPKDKLDIVFKAAMQGCRDKTLAKMSLPEGESFTIEYVNDKAWSGYNWYQGNSISLIQINTDFPIYIPRAIDLGCHEGYPGHHTYNARLESELVNKKGWLELSVYPLFSPQSLIAEGTANYGITMAFPGDERITFEQNKLMPLAGLDPKFAQQYHAFLSRQAKLSYAGNEVARDYINGDISRVQAIALQAKYSLSNTDRAEQRIRFVEKYGAYVINYNWGKDLVSDYVEANSAGHAQRWQVFTDLLSSPRVPSSLSW